MSYYHRNTWTFSYKAQQILDALDRQITRYKDLYTDVWTHEQHLEHELAQYRETLREAGVLDWEIAVPPKTQYSRDKDKFLSARRSHVKQLDELLLLRRVMNDQCKTDAHRMFKLTLDDVKFFGLDK